MRSSWAAVVGVVGGAVGHLLSWPPPGLHFPEASQPAALPVLGHLLPAPGSRGPHPRGHSGIPWLKKGPGATTAAPPRRPGLPRVGMSPGGNGLLSTPISACPVLILTEAPEMGSALQSEGVEAEAQRG